MSMTTPRWMVMGRVGPLGSMICRTRWRRARVARYGFRLVSAKARRRTGARSTSFFLVNGVTIYGGFSGNETDLSQRGPSKSDLSCGSGLTIGC